MPTINKHTFNYQRRLYAPSVSLKAELLTLVLAAFPIDPGTYPEPFSAHTAAAVDSNRVRHEYYMLLLEESDVWIDNSGLFWLTASADPEDRDYLTWLLHRNEQALCGAYTLRSSTIQ